MPDLNDLIVMLSGIHVNAHKQHRAYAVAGHLVSNALGERWHKLPDNKRQLLIQNSTDRLWKNYMDKRKYSGLSTKDASEQTIINEMTFLKNLLSPKSR